MSINIIENDDPNYRYKMPRMAISKIGSGNGKNTIIENIEDVGNAISHPKETILKYFGIELGTNCNLKNNSIKGWHDVDTLTQILYIYIKSYIICPKCKMPETIPEIKGKKKNKKLQLNCSGSNCKEIIFNNNKNFLKGIKIIINYIENNEWKVQEGNMVLETGKKDDDNDDFFNPFD
jgi:translation initiation factor 5